MKLLFLKGSDVTIMSKKKKRKSNIVSIKNSPRRVNIGVVIFGLLLIYLISVILFYITRQGVAYDKVQSARFAASERATGMIFRNEEIIPAPSKGYAVPLVPDGSCVAKGEPVYKVEDSPEARYDTQGITKQKTLSDKEMGRVLDAVTSFQHRYKPEEFEKTYQLLDDIKKLEDSDEISESSLLPEENLIKAPTDGIFISRTDGYEKEIPSEISAQKLLSSVGRNQKGKKPATPAVLGKIQKNNDCKMVVPLKGGLKKNLLALEGHPIEVKFLDDGTSEWAEFHVLAQSERVIFYFSNPLIRFASKRYVETELIFDHAEGLKVPEKSLIKIHRYQVPAASLNLESWPNELICADGHTIPVPVWTEKQKDSDKSPSAYYVASTQITDDLRLKTGEPVKAGKISAVYVINQGYAKLTPVRVLSTSGDKRIVKPFVAGSLLNQDLIAADASKVTENEIVVD